MEVDMENKRFYPKIGRMFWAILIPSEIFMLAMNALWIFYPGGPLSVIVIVGTFVLLNYFLLTPCFGFVEFREKALFVKFGFFMKREIPYDKIRGIEKARKFYSDSMLSLKNDMEHLNIKYNKFDIISVSIKDEENFIRELKLRAGI